MVSEDYLGLNDQTVSLSKLLYIIVEYQIMAYLLRKFDYLLVVLKSDRQIVKFR